MQAKGTFEVQLAAAPAEPGRARVGRMLMDKQYSGALVATAQGEMLSAGNPPPAQPPTSPSNTSPAPSTANKATSHWPMPVPCTTAQTT